jgi:ATP-dependent DNA helicase PIF1
VHLISDGNLAEEVLDKKISLTDAQNLCDKVILCPKNEHALMVNEQILQRLPDSEKLYTSVDEVECEDGEDVSNYPTELLNSLTPSGMHPHKLSLKIGAVVMLLRNLDVHQGLCNGTRLIVRRLHDYTIDCEVATGSNKGNRTLIPKITLRPSDTFLPFKLRRHQIPVRLSFAMTINKSQGQTFNRLGLLLPQSVFSHGQLYVAFSRVRSLASIRVQTIDEKQNRKATKTRNVLFSEVL